MKGIKMSDCKFYVNEAERTVICVIPNTCTLLWDFLKDNVRWHDIDMYYAIDGTLEKELYMPNSFMGKAVCAEEDEWNEETGRLIAYSRAKNKCYKSFFKRANNLVQTVDRRLGDMVNTFNEFGEKISSHEDVLHAKIDHLLDTVKE